MTDSSSSAAATTDAPDSTPTHALSPEDIREFQDLVRHETGVDLSAQEAWDRAIELIALIRMLIRPDPEDPEAPSA
jgi:hypothetical protein